LNERFASMHNVLVIELNYRKAPAHPFPTALYDLEALMLAVFDDESLPIDKGRIAVGGFSAGGNLTRKQFCASSPLFWSYFRAKSSLLGQNNVLRAPHALETLTNLAVTDPECCSAPGDGPSGYQGVRAG
jgi:poly(3-hydroxybutyrate) depolymerase